MEEGERHTPLSLRPKKTKGITGKCLSDCHKLGLDTQQLGFFRLN